MMSNAHIVRVGVARSHSQSPFCSSMVSRHEGGKEELTGSRVEWSQWNCVYSRVDRQHPPDEVVLLPPRTAFEFRPQNWLPKGNRLIDKFRSTPENAIRILFCRSPISALFRQWALEHSKRCAAPNYSQKRKMRCPKRKEIKESQPARNALPEIQL